MERTLNREEQQLLALLHGHDCPIGNGKAREQLGWDEDTYAMAKEGLYAQGLVAFGRGRGGSIRLAEPNGQYANRPLGHKLKGIEAQGQEAPKPKGLKAKGPKAPKPEPNKSLETWIWDAACSIRGAKDAPSTWTILPLIFTKRLCDVFDDELDRIAAEVGSREEAFKLVKADKKLDSFATCYPSMLSTGGASRRLGRCLC